MAASIVARLCLSEYLDCGRPAGGGISPSPGSVMGAAAGLAAPPASFLRLPLFKRQSGSRLEANKSEAGQQREANYLERSESLENQQTL